MQASSIDQVISRLDDIVDDAASRRSRLGFFAAVYRRVTAELHDAIAAGRFEDGPRMERFDVVFANRYLHAYAAFRAGDRPSKSWRVAFEGADTEPRLILQHVLLGMNAHINLDLGIAAAQICPGDSIAGLQNDFRTINTILASLLEGVQEAIGRASPMLHVLDELGGPVDELLACFSLVHAREQAWRAATLLARVPTEHWGPVIALMDEKTAFLGRLLCQPGPLLEPALRLVRGQESDDVPGILRRLRASDWTREPPPSSATPELPLSDDRDVAPSFRAV